MPHAPPMPRAAGRPLARRHLWGLMGGALAAARSLAQTDCCYDHGGPGCEDPRCEAEICCFDPYCCSVYWDLVCINEANMFCLSCSTFGQCPLTDHGCFAIGEPGCDDEDCCFEVCSLDRFCCDVVWDGLCIGNAAALCAPNNLCRDAIPIYDGLTPLATTHASSGCPYLPVDCAIGGDALVHNDIWYLYRASCGGVVTVELLSDTIIAPRLAAYTACPQDGGEFLACDGGQSGSTSKLSFLAWCGKTYVLRVGGYGGGILSIVCDGGACPCSPCVGDLNGSGAVEAGDLSLLLANWGVPQLACADLDSDGAVGAVDLAILLAGWNGCAAIACPPSGHGCLEPGGPGCDDLACCQAVCLVDPSCCSAAWDALCVGEAAATCPLAQDCCSPHSGPGCGVERCQTIVCAMDPFCCSVAWDYLCADEALTFCIEDCAGGDLDSPEKGDLRKVSG